MNNVHEKTTLAPCFQCGSPALDIEWGDTMAYQGIVERDVEIACSQINNEHCPVRVSSSVDTSRISPARIKQIERKLIRLWNSLANDENDSGDELAISTAPTAERDRLCSESDQDPDSEQDPGPPPHQSHTDIETALMHYRSVLSTVEGIAKIKNSRVPVTCDLIFVDTNTATSLLLPGLRCALLNSMELLFKTERDRLAKLINNQCV